jgi:hypothetical protein
MRFPFALTKKIASHIIKHKVRKTPKFAMVLQLEPLHTCNLTCTGCGRIREYSTSASRTWCRWSNACGGRGMRRADGFHLRRRTADLSEDRGTGRRSARTGPRALHLHERHVHAQKNARLSGRGLFSGEETKLKKLLDGKLITEKEAEVIRKSDDAAKLRPVIRPTKWMYWNVHVDGLEFTHDLIVEREGVFKECVEAIKMAKIIGYQVATNTTVYKETDVAEIEDMFKYLSSLEVDGHTISPGYDYDAAKKDMVSRLGKASKGFLPHARHDAPEICQDSGLGQGVHDFRHAGLSGISRRQTRTDLHRLGDPDLQRQGLESAVLSDD